MKPFDNPEDLAQQLSSDLAELISDTAAIGIDGRDGSGKTPLAEKLSTLLSVPFLSLDDHLIKNQDRYVCSLKCDEIQQRILAGAPTLLIEGVCLLAAADRCSFKIDKLIYVKRMDRHGFWADADECDPDPDPEKTIDKLTTELRLFAEIEPVLNGENCGNPGDKEIGLQGLTKEMIRYHATYRPVERATYLFHRVAP